MRRMDSGSPARSSRGGKGCAIRLMDWKENVKLSREGNATMREPLSVLPVDPVRPLDTVVQQDWHFLQSVAKPWLVKQRVPERMQEDILQTAWMHLYQARGRRPDMQLDYAFSCVKSARIDMWRKERHYVFPDEILGT